MNLEFFPSDPQYSFWVEASAGTGKTKILIDRCLRLILRGVPPNKILCLTYTKIAASEMEERLLEKLKDFAELSDEDLAKALELLNEKIHLDQVRTLIYAYLNDGNEIKIQTIHAFAQEILKKYSYEADISPLFKIMDEDQEEKAREKIFNQLFQSAKAKPLLEKILKEISLYSFKELIVEWIDLIYKNGEIPLKPNNVELFNNSIDMNGIDLNDFLELDQGSKTDQKIHSAVRSKNISELKNVFLTQDGQRQKRIFSKNINIKTQERILDLQERVFEFFEQEKVSLLLSFSNHLCCLGEIYWELFQKWKSENNLYNFGDMILLVLNLFEKKEQYPWVELFLAQNIQHILIDEAQDTSPLQWSLIQKVIIAIFDHDLTATVFVVGDFKQSIFSFQGADAHYFLSVYKKIEKILAVHDKEIKKHTLNISYRSLEEVLKFVDSSFKNDFSKGVSLGEDIFHSPFREGSGEVKTIGGLCQPDQAALEIQKIYNQHLCPMMILFRSRSVYVQEVIGLLKKMPIPFKGSDKWPLAEDDVFLDLIYLAKCLGNIFDETSLAIAVSSNIFSEKELLKNDILNLYLQKSKDLSLFEFYENFLWEGEIFNNFLRKYGPHVTMNIDLFLSKVLKFQNSKGSNLSQFALWIEEQKAHLKQDISHSDVIRALTIHGSKGLEAPVVIFLETEDNSILDQKIFMHKKTSFWSPLKENWPENFKFLRDLEKEKISHEKNRLLYVAFTRARDFLYILKSF